MCFAFNGPDATAPVVPDWFGIAPLADFGSRPETGPSRCQQEPLLAGRTNARSRPVADLGAPLVFPREAVRAGNIEDRFSGTSRTPWSAEVDDGDLQ